MIKITRKKSNARRHLLVSLEMRHLGLTTELHDSDPPDSKHPYKDAVVKFVVEAPQDLEVDTKKIRDRAIDGGAAHVYPVEVQRTGKSFRNVEATKQQVIDPFAALRRFAKDNPPPEGIDPIQLAKTLLCLSED